MKKISKILQISFLSGMICLCAPSSSQAFLPIPPMPWSIEVDIPGNAGKVVSCIKSAIRYLNTIRSQSNTLILDSLKTGLIGEYDSVQSGTKGQKTPGKASVEANATLNISGGETSEEKLYNAYYRLFLMYPNTPSNDYKYQVVHTAYKHKTNEYIQDTLVDTYLIGRLTEDYLVLVEKTLDRLDKCQRDANVNLDECVFWGMKFVRVDSVENRSEIGEDNSGQISAAMNAYIVTTVYDRLMRIIEDLTAVEAIYRSAKQIEATEPYAPDAQSSAEDYVPQKYNFAYNEVKDHSYADVIISSKLQSSCVPGTKGCSLYNNVPASVSDIENAEVLTKLQEAEDYLNKALTSHNLIAKMPEYKTEYRRYRKAEDIHKRTLKILEQSDDCATEFMSKYQVQGQDEVFWSSTRGNDYGNRLGVSRALIEAYEQETQEKITGTNSACDGYYQTCPSGYVVDEGKEACLDDGVTYYPCVVKVIQRSDGDGNEVIEDDLSVLSSNITEDNDAETSEDASKYLVNSSDEDTLETENRRKAEQTWRIGYDKLMDLTENSYLKFDPWVDQQVLQFKYLMHKYSNMKIIIKSIDKGINSFKIASKLAGNETVTDPMEGNIKNAAEKIAKCESWSNAINLAKQQMGCSAYNTTCVNQSNKNTGIIKLEKTVKDSSGNETKTTQTWVQRVGSRCDFEKDSSFSFASASGTGSCPAVWDFTIDFLVKHYFSDILGDCGSNIDSQARNLDAKLKDKGREVLQDKIAKVVNMRAEYDVNIKEFVRQYQDAQKVRTEQLKAIKDQIDGYNSEIGKATEKKNILQQEYTRTKNYLASLDNELKGVEEDIRKNRNNTEQVCTLKIKKWNLTAEKDYLENGTRNTWKCPCEEKLCQRLNGTEGEININIVTDVNSSIEDERTFIRLETASNIIKQQNALIKEYEKKREDQQKLASLKEEEIADAADEFSDPDNDNSYIAKLVDNQGHLEDENKKLENALNNAGKRMWKPGHEYAEDNLQTTLNEILSYKNDGSLENAVKKRIKNEWLDTIKSVLSVSNVFPKDFFLDVSIAEVFGLSSGYQTAEKLAEAIIDKMAAIAAQSVVADITRADDIIKAELDDAIALVENFQNNTIGIKEETPLPVGSNNLSGTAKKIMNRDYYGENKEITQAHEVLINKLRKPLSGLIDDRSTLFGIPSEENLGMDTEYFVALPARGNNYPGILTCSQDGASGDCNAGRDFRSPKEPLLNLPPLREVFYYSASDYDNTPKSKKHEPSISHLLNLKFGQWETLPEIWRHLLARPNLRDDGKYQQTFVERSYSRNDLRNLLEPINADAIYATKIARAGVYPCRLGYSTIMDIIGSNNAKDIRFGQRKTLPDTLTSSEIPNCREIAINKAAKLFGTNIPSPCYQYHSRDNGICHLLADHGVKNVTDYQKKLGRPTSGLYNNYSELGQFLKMKKKKKNYFLVYRPLQEAIQKYLLDKKNSKNNIDRQKAEMSSFKRNIFGSFLDVVVAENDAHKNLENTKENINSTLESLCKQIYDVPETVEVTENGIVEHSPIITGQEENCEGRDNKEECIQKNVEECAKYVADQGGLAKTAEDKVYYENKSVGNDKDEKDYKGFDCPNSNNDFYSAFVCKLRDRKDQYIKYAKGIINSIEGYEDIPEVKERMSAIENTIKVLDKGDKYGIAYLTPDIQYSKVEETVKEARANRIAVRKADEEGIKSMDNQTQIVPYCPVYAKTKKAK